MFHTYDVWQERVQETLLSSLFNLPGLRAYRCFEVPINIQIYHVDVVLPGTHTWKRLIFNHLDDVLAFLRNAAVQQSLINVQTQRSESKEYEIRSVAEILEGAHIGHVMKRRALVYSDGSKQVDSIAEIKIDELTCLSPVWRRTQGGVATP